MASAPDCYLAILQPDPKSHPAAEGLSQIKLWMSVLVQTPCLGADPKSVFHVDREYVSGVHVCFCFNEQTGIVVIQCLSKRGIRVDGTHLTQGATASLRQGIQVEIGSVAYKAVVAKQPNKSIYEACLRQYDSLPSLGNLWVGDSVQTKTESTRVYLLPETDNEVEASPRKGVNCRGSLFVVRKRTLQSDDFERHASYLICHEHVGFANSYF